MLFCKIENILDPRWICGLSSATQTFAFLKYVVLEFQQFSSSEFYIFFILFYMPSPVRVVSSLYSKLRVRDRKLIWIIPIYNMFLRIKQEFFCI